MNLSEHFTLAELIQSQTAARKGINNMPPQEAIACLQLLCAHVLEPVRSHYGVFSPSSGYRSPKLNAAVGGSDTSQHPKGQAVDFVIPGVSCPSVCGWIKANIEFDQLILEFWNEKKGTGWVHCSYNSRRNRQQFLIINSK